jgi:pyridoxal phosphate enzyme (YggS family)
MAMSSAAADAGRDPGDLTLVAVVKGVRPTLVAAVHAAGLRHLAHNRVADAAALQAALGPLSPPACWHMVGHLQRNKVRQAVATFDTVDSLDSLRLAEALDAAAGAAQRVIPVLIEVNVSGEPAKQGVAPEEVAALAGEVEAAAQLTLEGLKGLGPLSADERAVTAAFTQLATLCRDLEQRLGRRLPRLSMGMSGDFPLAIAVGATEVRLGQALFAI